MAARVGIAVLLVALLAPASASAAGPIGTGAAQVWILRPAGPARRVVVFLHGWGELSPAGDPWVAHLRARGAVVVFPRYQLDVSELAARTVGHLRAALRLAFARPGLRGRPVTAVGYSWGATLAFRYAVAARAWGLPAPRAVAGVFPASLAYGGPPARPLPASIRVLLMAGADRTSGDAYRAWLGPSARVLYVVVPGADHGAPGRGDATARRVYWARVDTLVEAPYRK